MGGDRTPQQVCLQSLEGEGSSLDQVERSLLQPFLRKSVKMFN